MAVYRALAAALLLDDPRAILANPDVDSEMDGFGAP